MESSNASRILSFLLGTALLLAGCCAYDPVLYAQLGKSKTDVMKAFKNAEAKDVATARDDLNELVGVAQEDKKPWCSEPISQAQDIKAIFDGTDFKRKGSKIYVHKQENVTEAIDKAIQTQDRLKK